MKKEREYDNLHNEGNADGFNPFRVARLEREAKGTQEPPERLYRSDVIRMLDRIEGMVRQSLSAEHRAEQLAEAKRLNTLLETIEDQS